MIIRITEDLTIIHRKTEFNKLTQEPSQKVHLVNITKEQVPEILYIEYFKKDVTPFAAQTLSRSAVSKYLDLYKIYIKDFVFIFESKEISEMYFKYFLGDMKISIKDTYPEYFL